MASLHGQTTRQVVVPIDRALAAMRGNIAGRIVGVVLCGLADAVDGRYLPALVVRVGQAVGVGIDLCELPCSVVAIALAGETLQRLHGG